MYLHCDDVIIVCAIEHLNHVFQVHAHADVPVTSVVLKAIRAQVEGDERDMTGVHGLKGKARCAAVEVGICD